MRSHSEKVKLFYGMLSKGYDLMDVLLFPKGKRNPREGLAKKLPEAPLKILDVCCGTGCSSVAMAAERPDSFVAGIDITGNMLKIARKKAEKQHLDNVAFLEMDASGMEFGDQEFDIVTISLAFHEMPVELMNKILTEIGRVLKQNGRLYIIEWERNTSGPGRFLFSFFPALFEPGRFRDFLKIDWSRLLQAYGMRFLESEHFSYTRLISAERTG